MELKSDLTLHLPIETVWDELTDFDHLEHRLRVSGTDIARSDEPDPPGIGTVWKGAFDVSGKARAYRAEITTFSPCEAIMATIESAGVAGLCVIALRRVSADRTNVSVHVTLKGQTIAAKLFLKPLALAQGKLETGLERRLDHLARGMEGRHPPVS